MGMRSVSENENESGTWIDCRERMPDRDGWYLVASSDFRPPCVYVLECRDTACPEHAHWRANSDWHGYVAHWQPLPAPPPGDSP